MNSKQYSVTCLALTVIILLVGCGKDDAPVTPKVEPLPPTMTGTWVLDFGDETKYYLDIQQNDSLLNGNYRDGVDTLWIDGTVSRMTRVVSIQVFGRIYHFPQGEAQLWLDGQVNEDRTEFVGLQWFKLTNTGDALIYALFNAKKM